jgi:hypothetical protein
VITLKVDFVLNNCVGYRAAAMHASGKYLCAIDENYAVHDFCMDSACALGEENQVPVTSPNGASPFWTILPTSRTPIPEMFRFTRLTQAHARAIVAPSAVPFKDRCEPDIHRSVLAATAWILL